MKIRQLTYFVSAVKLGSLSAAAKERGVSVQAVSKAMAQLEAEVGRPLFERGHGGTMPTSFARGLYAYASKVVEGFSELEGYVATYEPPKEADASGACREKPERVTIAIAMVHSHGGDVACSVLGSLCHKRLGVAAEFKIMTGIEAERELLSGNVDGAIFTGLVSHPGLESTAIGSMSLRPLMRKGHPLASARTIDAHDLAGFPLLMSSEYAAYGHAVLMRLADLGVHPSGVLDSAQGAGVERDVNKGDALMLTADAPLFASGQGQLVSRPFSRETPVAIPVTLAVVRESNSAEVRFLREVAGKGLARALLSGMRSRTTT